MGCFFAQVRCRRSRLDRGYGRGNALLGAQRESHSLYKVLVEYPRFFHLLWRIKRAEWSLASAWRLHTSATHVRLEQALLELKGALHRCSLVRGQMFSLTTKLSNYMMFEVLETSWGTLQHIYNRAELLRVQEKHTEAFPLLERALRIRTKKLGENHPDTVGTRSDLEFVREKG